MRTLLLAIVVIASLFVSDAGLRAAPLRKPTDFFALQRVSTIGVVRSGVLGTTVRLLFKQERAETFAKIEALEPDLRALIWLVFLHDRWGRDGLHTYFFLYGGDFAPQVLQSLRHAKLDREAAIFSHAMALFGPHYPVAEEERKQFFAWGKPGRRVDEVTTIPNELNAFDHALMNDADAFGSREQLAERIAAYVERTASLTAWTDSARAKMTDEQRLDWLLQQLTVESDNSEDIRAQIANWPKPYRQLFLLDLFNMEILNGGVHQFFFNSSGDFALEVVATMREVGLIRHADALQRAVDMFGRPYPSDREVRFGHFKEGWSDWDRKLNAPTDEIRDGEIDETMLAILKREGLMPQ